MHGCADVSIWFSIPLSMTTAHTDSSPISQDNATKFMDKIMALSKRRGFNYPASEIYGGVNGLWDYSPVRYVVQEHHPHTCGFGE